MKLQGLPLIKSLSTSSVGELSYQLSHIRVICSASRVSPLLNSFAPTRASLCLASARRASTRSWKHSSSSTTWSIAMITPTKSESEYLFLPLLILALTFFSLPNCLSEFPQTESTSSWIVSAAMTATVVMGCWSPWENTFSLDQPTSSLEKPRASSASLARYGIILTVNQIWKSR